MNFTAAQFQNPNTDGVRGLADFLHGFADARTGDFISTFGFFKIERTLFDQILQVFIFLHVDPRELRHSARAWAAPELTTADPPIGFLSARMV